MQFIILTVTACRFQLSKYLRSNTLHVRPGLNYIKPVDIFESIHRWVKFVVKKI